MNSNSLEDLKINVKAEILTSEITSFPYEVFK